MEEIGTIGERADKESQPIDGWSQSGYQESREKVIWAF
jgi:hypothetical protein